ncbi:MAG TPA: folylpolyglutamate synthase/dihydrofolate synthase family protein [Nitrospira sp.]|jgi:dihydrofolate synthase / folylpolyglutamate synthase|nr:folylpolyglutamate synthase/dihydrofolate synthase family protein [Nitrospira sp.]
MTYNAAVSYLYSLQKHGIKLGLDTMTALAGRLGMPQARYPSLHIAGTNGKGSTAAMAAAMLSAGGYRVGLYTSPHLVDFRERIRVNGRMVSEADIARLTEVVKGVAEPDLSPTFFEFTTAIAFLYFAESKVDVAVLEVGLGGRFDATNVVSPMACAITTIALDHQQYLGNTVESISFEKAGIIKPNTPVIVGRLPTAAHDTIERISETRHAPLLSLGRDFHVEGETPARFTYWDADVRFEQLSCPLLGAHQLDNCACAVALVKTSRYGQGTVGEPAIRQGLRQVYWEGRLEAVATEPLTVLDGAHNPAAAAALADYLRRFRTSHPSSRVILVLAMMRDKDHAAFVEALRGLVHDVVLTQAALKRSATVEELLPVVSVIWPSVRTRARAGDALAEAREIARPQDLICVTGSLMLIGEVKALLRGCGLSPLRG